MINKVRQPSLYISHGGGPCFWMDDFPAPFGADAFNKLRDFLAGLLATLPARPTSILLISAHWEEQVPTFGTSSAPAMIYDYYGFPPHTYELKYPALGLPALAVHAADLLRAVGIDTAFDDQRGFDHGVFVPMLIVDPTATIPVVTLSLQQGMDPAQHIAIGAALQSLRDEGVLIIGSGSSYHNLREFFDGVGAKASAFDGWLQKTVTMPDAAARNAGLIAWEQAPEARACHPREEHLLPLMVAAGAGGNDRGAINFQDVIGGKAVCCVRFG